MTNTTTIQWKRIDGEYNAGRFVVRMAWTSDGPNGSPVRDGWNLFMDQQWVNDFTRLRDAKAEAAKLAERDA